MIAALLTRLGAWLYKLGRKDVRVARRGEILFESYYPLFHGRAGKWRFPNVVLHHFRNDFSDDYRHDHGRACLSFILTGGYLERRPSGERWRKPGSVSWLGFDEWHDIPKVQPGTWTLFFTGWMRREPHFHFRGRVLTRSQVYGIGRAHLAGMVPETPELHERLAKRREAAKRFDRMRSKDKAITRVEV